MNAGKLINKINILSLSSTTNGTATDYQWIPSDMVWACVERLSQASGSTGIRQGARAARFTVRKTDLELANAILWQGRYYFITDIVEIYRAFCDIEAVLIEPKTCVVAKYSHSLNELNRPIINEASQLTFPGYLMERCDSGADFIQRSPMAEFISRHVLATPKAVLLKVGELVRIDESSYTVTSIHENDFYKNEYELLRKEDA